MSPPQSSPELDRARSFIDSNEQRFRDQLFELLRVPSVSGDSARRDAMKTCAELVRQRMSESGLEVEIVPTDGHPILYGERRGAEGGPALLVYGHYDVQPAQRSDGWRHDPFEPTVENGSVVARGATDDKGQVFALLCGIRAAIENGVGPDVTIKCIIEGEEEVGSANLMPFVREQRDRLSADAVIISDSSLFADDVPAITYGLRGIVCFELVLRGPRQDLHSGSYGGAVNNPANVLPRVLAACQEPFGRVAIPRFYDRVRPLEKSEREEFRRLPHDDSKFLGEVGAPALWGEEGYTTLERKWARPTFDVNGLVGGYGGEGPKTVLPAEARAKVSMRLVPDQDPEEILELTREFVLSLVPDSIEAEFIPQHGAKPVLVDRSMPAFAAAENAIEVGFGKRPVFIREGGSIPVVNTFKEALGIDSILIGLGLPDDGAHGPNEKFSLKDFRRGMVTMAALVDQVSGSNTRSD